MVGFRFEVQAQHAKRVKLARLSHARLGRSYVSVTIEKLEDLRMDLLMHIASLPQQDHENVGFAPGYETDFPVFDKKDGLSHNLIATLMKDTDAFEHYCHNNLTMSPDCDDLQNDLHRIVQGREMLAKLFVTDRDLFSQSHVALLRKAEVQCHLNGLCLLTVIAQVDPEQESWGESWETNEAIRGEFDRFYQTCGYTRVHENDFAYKTAAQEAHAVYSKDLSVCLVCRVMTPC
jgi:hypothetical protein